MLAAMIALDQPPTASRRTHCLESSGFSLLELLVVIAVVATLVAVAASNFGHSANHLSKAAYDVSDFLRLARAHALAQNTYVWVGLVEVDQSQSPDAGPQTNGFGRLALLAIYSKDSTKVYDDTDPDWTTVYNQSPVGGRWGVLGKLLRLENVHLADIGFPETGKLMRPEVPDACRLGHASSVSTLKFSYPLAAPIGLGRYNFQKVIQFDPQGIARIVQGPDSLLTVPERLEIGLQQSHGNTVPNRPSDPNSGKHCAIQIDGLTGAVELFRP